MLSANWHPFCFSLNVLILWYFADNIFFNENWWILIEISLKFVPERSITNMAALVQIVAWRCTQQAIIWSNDGTVRR